MDNGGNVILAHDIEGENAVRKTADIGSLDGEWNFESFLLSENVLKGLKAAGFKKPSPVQQQAIPAGRCGIDLMVQAKSGTGKTCVFTVIALETVQPQNPCVQALIIAPTREIASQINSVVETIGVFVPNLKCSCVIGGMTLKEGSCAQFGHIVTGTPGRLCQLIKQNDLLVDKVRLFVLDEADKLMEEDYSEDMRFIRSALGSNKQVIAVSATFTEALHKDLNNLMKSPIFINPSKMDIQLLGVKQYVFCITGYLNSKILALHWLLTSISFSQCIVFVNFQDKVTMIYEKLKKLNWPVEYMCSKLNQNLRSGVIKHLKAFQCRVLISTDLASRGIDASHVNLVINFDVPSSAEVYFHRIGRAGRYGGHGAAVTIFGNPNDMRHFLAFSAEYSLSVRVLPADIPSSLIGDDQFREGLAMLDSDCRSFSKIAALTSSGFDKRVDKAAISIICDERPTDQYSWHSDYEDIFQLRRVVRVVPDQYSPSICRITNPQRQTDQLDRGDGQTLKYSHERMIKILKFLIDNNYCETEVIKRDEVQNIAHVARSFISTDSDKPVYGSRIRLTAIKPRSLPRSSQPSDPCHIRTEKMTLPENDKGTESSGEDLQQSAEPLFKREDHKLTGDYPLTSAFDYDDMENDEQLDIAEHAPHRCNGSGDMEGSRGVRQPPKQEEETKVDALFIDRCFNAAAMGSTHDAFIGLYTGFGEKIYEQVLNEYKTHAEAESCEEMTTDNSSASLLKVDDVNGKGAGSPSSKSFVSASSILEDGSQGVLSVKSTAIDVATQTENYSLEALYKIVELQNKLLQQYMKILPDMPSSCDEQDSGATVT